MFGNVPFLTMEENSFAAVDAKEKKTKSFYTRERLVLYSKFEHPSILPIQL